MATSRKILVIEDEPIQAQIVGLLCEQLGMASDWAPDAASALEKADRHPDAYAMVLVDYQLSNLDGWLLATRLRSRLGEAVPLVGVTGWALPALASTLRSQGYTEVLSKPYGLEALKGLLHRHAVSAGCGCCPPGGPPN